jgi:hypothetical protein
MGKAGSVEEHSTARAVGGVVAVGEERDAWSARQREACHDKVLI